MSKISILKRQRNNIKKKKYNKYKINIVKNKIKEFKKNIIKLDNKKINKNKSLLFSILDKLKNKKILTLNKISRIKSILSKLINKNIKLAH
ncbi:MAG: 30S ribosomal protein S20 [Candidatus Shikimatogenerans bostrichidophilus]|nr:MAG: 30S ribosomal protein S20 [Candidatus Shikimatogenerans bostrichidophilus]